MRQVVDETARKTRTVMACADLTGDWRASYTHVYPGRQLRSRNTQHTRRVLSGRQSRCPNRQKAWLGRASASTRLHSKTCGLVGSKNGRSKMFIFRQRGRNAGTWYCVHLRFSLQLLFQNEEFDDNMHSTQQQEQQREQQQGNNTTTSSSPQSYAKSSRLLKPTYILDASIPGHSGRTKIYYCCRICHNRCVL